MSDSIDSKGRRTARRDLTRPGIKAASDGEIKAASELLVAKKSLLDRPPRPVKLVLPDVARSTLEAVRLPEAATERPAVSECPSLPFDPDRVKIPEGGDSNRSDETPPSRGWANGERAANQVRSKIHPTSTGRGFSSAGPAIVGIGPIPVSRPLPSTDPVKFGGDPRVSSSPDDGDVSGPRCTSVASNRASSGGRVAMKVEALGIANGLGRTDKSENLDGFLCKNVGNPAEHGISPSFVRNPPAIDLKSLSLASSGGESLPGVTADQGGMHKEKLDLPAGWSASPEGGASVDLSRTNDLLQQLIDAVRRQRDASLPGGGRAVYPDR